MVLVGVVVHAPAAETNKAGWQWLVWGYGRKGVMCYDGVGSIPRQRWQMQPAPLVPRRRQPCEAWWKVGFTRQLWYAAACLCTRACLNRNWSGHVGGGDTLDLRAARNAISRGARSRFQNLDGSRSPSDFILARLLLLLHHRHLRAPAPSSPPSSSASSRRPDSPRATPSPPSRALGGTTGLFFVLVLLAQVALRPPLP